MKRCLFFILIAVTFSLTVSADECIVDGIYYNLVTKAKEAEVKRNPSKYSGSIVIPDTITYEGITYSVTSIGNEAFYWCRELSAVTLSSSLKTIGNCAFEECSGLTSVTIPNSVTSIGYRAFNECSNLTSVTIPNSVISIGNEAFAYCSSLTSVTIPNSMTTIGASTFQQCSSLASVTIPNSVTTIESYTFEGCSSLTSVTIPNSVTTVASNTFQNCSSLTSVTISNSVTRIASYTFDGCRSLTSVTIPNSVTSIGDYAFNNCSSLTSVTIPNSVTRMGSYTFQNCSILTSVTIPNSVPYIGVYTFKNCRSFTSVTIPNSVKDIYQGAFEGCSSLTSVIIGENCKNIMSIAFSNCKELTDVYCYAERVPSTASDAFLDSYIEYSTLHVPTASVAAYKSAEPWNGFKMIEGLDGKLPDEPKQKCAIPKISYMNGKLTFTSDTEGAVFVSEITDEDVKTYESNEITLSVTYNICVYATKSGYDNSDVLTAKLCWIDAEPTKEGFDEKATTTNDIKAQPVLIQSRGGVLTVSGIEDGTFVQVFTMDGRKVVASVAQMGEVQLVPSLTHGTPAIIKIGNRGIKVLME